MIFSAVRFREIYRTIIFIIFILPFIISFSFFFLTYKVGVDAWLMSIPYIIFNNLDNRVDFRNAIGVFRFVTLESLIVSS